MFILQREGGKFDTMFKENKINVARIYPLTNKRKKKIFATIQDIKDEIFNISYLEDFIREDNSLDNIELTKLLNINLNEYTKCLFIENQFAWISENEDKKQRYFTKGHLTYGLDIYDLLSIYFNCTYPQIFNYLLDMGYNQIDKSKKRNRLKYDDNMNKVMDIIQSNENLEKLLKDKVDIYVALNDFAKNNSLTFNKYKDEQIFFISTRFLKERYSLSYSISTINQVINLYALIGLIYKVPEKELESDIYKAYTVNPKKAPVNFYSIPKIEDIVETIKENSFIITNKKINYHNLNKNKVFRLQEIRNKEINYTTNKGGGDKTKKAKQAKIEKDSMETLFLYYLEREGVVAKEWIKESKEITLKNTAFDKKWKELVSRNKGMVVKPNKVLKEKYGLKSKQDIFIAKESA